MKKAKTRTRRDPKKKERKGEGEHEPRAPGRAPASTSRYGSGRYQVVFLDVRSGVESGTWNSVVVEASDPEHATRRALDKRPLARTPEWIVMPLEGPPYPVYLQGNVRLDRKEQSEYQRRARA